MSPIMCFNNPYMYYELFLNIIYTMSCIPQAMKLDKVGHLVSPYTTLGSLRKAYEGKVVSSIIVLQSSAQFVYHLDSILISVF